MENFDPSDLKARLQRYRQMRAFTTDAMARRAIDSLILEIESELAGDWPGPPEAPPSASLS